MRIRLYELFYLLCITVIATIFIHLYCVVFYDAGLLAKGRLETDPRLIFLVIPVLFWISSYLCRSFASSAAGSSLSRIKSALTLLKASPNSYEKISHLLSLRVVFVTMVSSIISTFAGGALGREAPSVLMAGSIFVSAAEKFRKTFGKISLENWLYIGCSVGFAVAFLAPIAGVFYLLEKLAKGQKKLPKAKNYPLVFSLFFAAFIVAGILYDNPPIFATSQIEFVFNWQMLALVFLSIICGILAFFFNKLALISFEKLSAIKSWRWHLVPIAAGLAVAAISFYCGPYSFSGGIKTVNDALNGVPSEVFSKEEILGRIFNTIISFASGCAGGLVAPAIAIGAGIGSFFANLAALADVKVFMLVGITSFLASILGLPLTATIATLETTDQSFFLSLLLLLPAFISFYTTKLMENLTEGKRDQGAV